MTPLLSEIGLPLDLIGAALLAFGLFRPSKPLYPGWQRSPWEASEDQAYGAVGFLSLASASSTGERARTPRRFTAGARGSGSGRSRRISGRSALGSEDDAEHDE